MNASETMMLSSGVIRSLSMVVIYLFNSFKQITSIGIVQPFVINGFGHAKSGTVDIYFLELYVRFDVDEKAAIGYNITSQIGVTFPGEHLKGSKYVLVSNNLADANDFFGKTYQHYLGYPNFDLLNLNDGDDGIIIHDQYGQTLDIFGPSANTPSNACAHVCQYKLGWVKRKPCNVTLPKTSYDPSDWVIKPNALGGCTANAHCPLPFPTQVPGLCDKDECIGVTCQNGGTCNDGVFEYNCTCASGYTGKHCETDVDDCKSTPCQNGGTCTDRVNGYTCACVKGFSGLQCETNIDDCSPDPCTNGGICVDRVAQYSCECPAGFSGAKCENKLTTTTESTTSTSTTSTIPTTTTATTSTTTSTSTTTITSTTTPTVPTTTTSTTQTTTATTQTAMATSPATTPTKTQTTATTTTITTGKDAPVKECSPLKVPAHVKIDTDDVRVQTVVTATCDFGYEFDDGTSRRSTICLASQEWLTVLPQPKRKSCDYLGNVQNASISTEDNNYGSSVIITCKNGLRMLDGTTEKTVTCTAIGKWSDDVTSCSSRRCPPLPVVHHASPNSTNADVGVTAAVTCSSGYMYPGDLEVKHVTCEGDESWRPNNIDSCYPVQCPTVPDIAHGAGNSSLRLFGTTVQLTCDRGYQFPGQKSSMTIFCQRNRQWNIAAPDCSIIHCPASQPISNAVRFDGGTTYLSEVKYDCELGYRFLNGKRSHNISCTEFGTWNETDFDCKKERCIPIPEAANTLPSTTNTSWWTVVVYSCRPGYRFADESTKKAIECNTNALWNSSVPSCFPMNCSHLQEVKNAVPIQHVSNALGATFHYQCVRGHVFPGNETQRLVTCSADVSGVTWQPTLPSCQPRECPEVPEVRNATTNDTDHVFASTVTYSCPDGWEVKKLGSHPVITCQDDGTWDHVPTECEPVRCPSVPEWGDARFNTTEREYGTALSYSCDDGFAFPDASQTKTSQCSSEFGWQPPLESCNEMESIAADLKGKSYEAENAVSIGSIAIGILSAVMAAIIALDCNKIINDLGMLKLNLRDAYQVLATFRGGVTPEKSTCQTPVEKIAPNDEVGLDRENTMSGLSHTKT